MTPSALPSGPHLVDAAPRRLAIDARSGARNEPSSQRARRFYLAGALLLAGAMGIRRWTGPDVRVGCDMTAGGFSCSVAHDAGNGPVRACWDIVLTCRDGLETRARDCTEVRPSETATVQIPDGSFPRLASCGVISKMFVANLALDER